MLSLGGQIEHLKEKGVLFNIMDESTAKDYLEQHNNYFKLTAYRKNYDKHPAGENYEEGLCKALGYKGLYLVTYTAMDDGVYEKKCMACYMIQDGRCPIYEACEIFSSAPKTMENNWKLRSKKMG